MSRQYDEKQRPGKSKPASTGVVNGAGMFIPFHPTVVEREAIKAMDVSEAELIGMIGALVDRGLTIKITANRAASAYCAVIAPQGQAFGQGTALSCFHASVFTLLRMVMYILYTKWPDYPEQGVTADHADLDW